LKNLIYIGNKSITSSRSNLSSIDILAPLLENEGYNVYPASNKKNIIIRLIDMLWICFKHRKQTDYVLIDTYSTLNFYYAYSVSYYR
jgi:cellulose biosynthesis protein BcsQ